MWINLYCTKDQYFIHFILMRVIKHEDRQLPISARLGIKRKKR